MIQLDVFRSFAVGASLAAFAGNLLVREPSWSKNDYFVYNVLYLSLLSTPASMFLLWTFPGWESMFIFDNRSAVHPAVATVLAVVNVLVGILAFRSAYLRIRRGLQAEAHTLWIRAYVLMFGILGFGYARALYAGDASDWANDVPYALRDFVKTDVFQTLLSIGVLVLPALFYGPITWLAHPANANLRRFDLPDLVLRTVGEMVLWGVLGYTAYMFYLPSDERRYYAHGPLGFWSPLAGFVTAEAAFAALAIGLWTAGNRLVDQWHIKTVD